MKDIIALALVSVFSAAALAIHEYSVTNDATKSKQLFARSLCFSVIAVSAVLYFSWGSGVEPFDTVPPMQSFSVPRM